MARRKSRPGEFPSPSATGIGNALDTLLDDAYWIPTLQSNVLYARTHDDCDGDMSQTIEVGVGPDGDLWVATRGRRGSLRFRSFGGGGMSLRVRNALLVLAEAICCDNADRPQRQRAPSEEGEAGPPPLGL